MTPVLWMALFAILGIFIGISEGRLSDRLYHAAILVYITGLLIGFPYAIVWAVLNGVNKASIILFFVYALITGIGTGVGYHRYLTHGSFKTKPWVELMLLVFGSMALPVGGVSFAVNHHKHHAHADQDGDPHSPRDGIWHAHMGHMLKAVTKDLQSAYGQRLIQNRLAVAIDQTWFIWFFGLGFLLPYAIAGWDGVVLAGILRLVYHNHITFSVNSLCHIKGSRPFNTPDNSRNFWPIGVLSFGEGFHNNHHAGSKWAYHGHGKWEWDLNGYVIRLLERAGLAWNVVVPTPEAIEKRKKQLAVKPATAD